jgi:hypothetical protein
VVAGASQRAMEATQRWSQSMTLLYSAAVRLLARLVKRCGLSFRFSGGLAGPGGTTTGHLTGPYDTFSTPQGPRLTPRFHGRR